MRIIIETDERAASIVQPLAPGVAAAPSVTTQAGFTQLAATPALGVQPTAPLSAMAIDGGTAPKLPSAAAPEGPAATNGPYAPLGAADVPVIDVGAAPKIATAREVIARAAPGMALPPSARLPNEFSTEEHVEPPADRLLLAHDEGMAASGVPAGSAPEGPKHERGTHAARRRSARDEAR
jgi:hypothetical protein